MERAPAVPFCCGKLRYHSGLRFTNSTYECEACRSVVPGGEESGEMFVIIRGVKHRPWVWQSVAGPPAPFR